MVKSVKEYTPTQLAEELLRRKQAQDSLLSFTEYTHPAWQTAEIHRTICHYLEMLERGDIEKLAINAPPRHGKTELASRRFPAWVLGRHPDWQMISASSGGDLANDIGADVRDIIRDPTYKNIFPATQLRKDAAAAGRWRTENGGIYLAGSVGSQIVGRGANLGIIDDPHKGAEEAYSQRMRNVVGDWYFGDFYNRLMPPYLQLLIMTRWHEDDLSGRLLPPEKEWTQLDATGTAFSGGGWTILKFRAIEKTQHGTETGLKHFMFPTAKLQDMRKTYMDNGKGRDWRSLFQQEPVSEEGTFIMRKWFDKRYKAAPKQMRIYMAGDFAVTKKGEGGRNPDRTELGVFGIGPDDKAYVLDWWTGQTTSDVWIEALLDLAEKWSPSAFFGEVGVIRRAVEPYLVRRMRERNLRVRLEWLPTTADKLSRGHSFQGWASTERIRFPEKKIWVEPVIDELCKVPEGRYWDKFDVFAHMFSAIDKTHAAIVPLSEPDDGLLHLSDYQSIGGANVNNWKTV
jgi:predicted phage terminase large subunit-like protein